MNTEKNSLRKQLDITSKQLIAYESSAYDSDYPTGYEDGMQMAGNILSDILQSYPEETTVREVFEALGYHLPEDAPIMFDHGVWWSPHSYYESIYQFTQEGWLIVYGEWRDLYSESPDLSELPVNYAWNYLPPNVAKYKNTLDLKQKYITLVKKPY